jgi:hypothetical protein
LLIDTIELVLINSTLLLQDEHHLLISKQYTQMPFAFEVLNVGIENYSMKPYASSDAVSLLSLNHSTATACKRQLLGTSGLFSEHHYIVN